MPINRIIVSRPFVSIVDAISAGGYNPFLCQATRGFRTALFAANIIASPPVVEGKMSRARFLSVAAFSIGFATTIHAAPINMTNSPSWTSPTAANPSDLVLVAETKKPLVKSPSVKAGATGPQTTVGSAELTAQECERVGGVVTGNGDPNCKSNQRCKTTLSNGDIRSV
ncbi:hypothetical protein [Rhizobiales bacterium]